MSARVNSLTSAETLAAVTFILSMKDLLTIFTTPSGWSNKLRAVSLIEKSSFRRIAIEIKGIFCPAPLVKEKGAKLMTPVSLFSLVIQPIGRGTMAPDSNLYCSFSSI